MEREKCLWNASGPNSAGLRVGGHPIARNNAGPCLWPEGCSPTVTRRALVLHRLKSGCSACVLAGILVFICGRGASLVHSLPADALYHNPLQNRCQTRQHQMQLVVVEANVVAMVSLLCYLCALS